VRERRVTGLEMVVVPAGECTIGAAARHGSREPRFAYDNQRPRQRTDVRGYQIGRTPITNASYLTFAEGGGYQRREWWSAEGWAWKEQYDITKPPGWTADHRSEWRLATLEPLEPHRPVVHVSWFEADAFARAHGARLPTEIEWEKAATWDQELSEARLFPWGDEPPRRSVHANIDQLDRGPAIAGGHPAGASPYGCLDMIGDAGEWTSSDFSPYPGFVATHTRSTRKCSSASTTRSCAGVHGQPARWSRPRRSATGITRSGARSSLVCASPEICRLRP
jgi:iron(II)-dependent oxidoreductase